MKPIHVLALGMGLALVPVASEVLYAYSIRRQVADLEEELRLAHPDWPPPRTAFRRFGAEVTRPDFSLLRDLTAWNAFRQGKPSELVQDLSVRNGYCCVYFTSDFGNERTGVHGFLWSPRLLRFVPFYSRCREGECRWRIGD